MTKKQSHRNRKEPPSASSLPLRADQVNELEAALLAETLRDPESYLPILERSLKPEHFNSPRHEVIFTKMLEVGVKPSIVFSRKVANVLPGTLKAYVLADLFTNVDSFVPKNRIEETTQEIREFYRLDGLRSELMESLKNAKTNLEVQTSVEAFREKDRELTSSADIVSFGDLVVAAIDDIARAKKEGVEIKTPWPDVDHYIGGLSRGDVIIVGGRPSMGKTTWSCNILAGVADQEKRVLLYCIEQPPIQIIKRLISLRRGIEGYKLRDGSISEEEWSSVAKISEERWHDLVFIPDVRSPRLEDIMGSVDRFNPDVLIVDQIQLVETAEDDTRALELSRFMAKIKNLSKERRIATIICSQLNRKVEERASKMPMVSDLKDSGGIEDFSDIIILLFWAHFYNHSKPKNELLGIIGKNRHGPTGQIEFDYKPEYFRITGKHEVPPHVDQRVLL